MCERHGQGSRRDVLRVFAAATAMSVVPTARAQASLDRTPARVIDVHAHFLPAAYRKALDRAGLKTLDGGVPVPSWDARSTIASMDRMQVGAEILSISSPALNFLEGSDAKTVARDVNEEASALVRAYPGRIGAFATLPLEDMQATLSELRYALDQLGLDGVMLPSNVKGRYLGDPHFLPLFEELHHRKAVAFMHPTSPQCMEQIGIGLPGPLIEFPFDTTRTVLDLLKHGVFRRYPDFRLILSHGGGALPMMSVRIGVGMGPAALAALAGLYYDTTMVVSDGPFGALRQLAPLSQILYGSDHGFAQEPEIEARLQALLRLDLKPHEQKAVLRDNALGLFPRFA